MIPDWAPSIHPLVIHFPIVLLLMAPLADVLGMTIHRLRELQKIAVGLYLLGALAAMAAFFSGRYGAEGLLLPEAANLVFLEHAEWAEWTVWFYGIYALVRLGFFCRGWTSKEVLRWVLFLIGGGGAFLLYETGDHGAQLVYQYGVGVQAMDQSRMKPHDHANHEQEKKINPPPEAEEGHDHEEGHHHE